MRTECKYSAAGMRCRLFYKFQVFWQRAQIREAAKAIIEL
ncbi:50S ribosomal protein L17 [Bacillus sp. NRRL B-14911]|nr:50S ribosomal protein L17 [Bacillus sp. NRRL B-14911]